MASVACARGPGANARVEVSKFLAIVTRAAAIVGAAWVSYVLVFTVVGFVAPAAPRQRIPAALTQAASQFISQICLFMAPFLVWLRIRRRESA